MIHFLHRMVQNDSSAKFATWLFRIATHLALNWIRDGRNEKSQISLDRETTDGAGRQVADLAEP
jgi:RNA polymerase sigma-70 factor, ECF subfamily